MSDKYSGTFEHPVGYQSGMFYTNIPQPVKQGKELLCIQTTTNYLTVNLLLATSSKVSLR